MKIRTSRRITTSITVAPDTVIDIPEYHALRLIECSACEAVESDEPKKRSARKGTAESGAIEKATVNRD